MAEGKIIDVAVKRTSTGDISNFETGQISVQNNSQTGCYKYSNFKYI
jgi:hypothetical protein